MLLKEIGRKIAQAFRAARAADEKVASSIAAALDAKAEQIKEDMAKTVVDDWRAYFE